MKSAASAPDAPRARSQAFQGPVRAACVFVLALVALMGVPTGWLKADQGAFERHELQTALAASQAQTAQLRRQLEEQEQRNTRLSEALATANAEAAQFRESYRKLRLQMEALGIAALDENDNGLQQRLLKALADLRLAESDKDALSKALFGLSEAVIRFANSTISPDEELSDELARQLQNAEAVLAAGMIAAGNVGGGLHHAQVVSLQEDLGLVVLNVGSRHGVRAGMPFRLYRRDKPIGTAMIVDVRDYIAGAVYRDAVDAGETIRVGDRAEIDSQSF